MRIERINGKKLVCSLGEDDPVDREVWRQITDRCRTQKTTEVALVYPIRRLSDVLPFMSEVTKITGHPVQGFSHDGSTIAPQGLPFG